MSHTIVTYTSWDGRLRGALGGACFGTLLFVGSFPLLTWNEGGSIQRYQSLEEGRKNVFEISDPTASVDHVHDGTLVYLSGKAEAGDGPRDPTFGLSPSETLKLRRVVEMYQWEERRSSKTTKTEGGGTRTETAYSYQKTWSQNLIDSASFSDASSHSNPSSMPYSSQTYAASPITVGSYTLSSELVNKINWFSGWTDDGSLSIDNIADDHGEQNAIVYENGFYIGDDPSYADIGDVKITFQYIPEGTVSLIAAQTGNTFSSYTTKRGGSLLLLRRGYHTSDELFMLAERDNVFITQLVRIVGFLLMYIGLKSIAAPLEVFLDRIPLVGRCFGDLMGGATSLVICPLAAALSILTISIAWIAYRPLFAFALLAIVAGLAYMVKRQAESKRIYDSDSSEMARALASPLEPSKEYV